MVHFSDFKCMKMAATQAALKVASAIATTMFHRAEVRKRKPNREACANRQPIPP